MDSESAYLAELLARIEAEHVRTLTAHDYPTDPDGADSDETWHRLQTAIGESKNPASVGYKVRRAYIGLLRLREVRNMLDAIEGPWESAHAARAVRHALAARGENALS